MPLVVGDADPEDVARVISALWGGPETLIVISSDLSHYHSYEKARQLDQATSDRIIHLESNLRGEEACGCRPVNGLLSLAKARQLKVELVDLRNSGDTAGSHDRVVGYGAYVINEPASKKLEQDLARQEKPEARYSLAERQQLLYFARQAITSALHGEDIQLPSQLPSSFLAQRATFVTLKIQGQLRGCIGSLLAHRSLIQDVCHNAVKIGRAHV